MATEERWYYSASHWHLGKVMVGNITFFDFCCFSSIAINIVDKWLFFLNIYFQRWSDEVEATAFSCLLSPLEAVLVVTRPTKDCLQPSVLSSLYRESSCSVFTGHFSCKARCRLLLSVLLFALTYLARNWNATETLSDPNTRMYAAPVLWILKTKFNISTLTALDH